MLLFLLLFISCSLHSYNHEKVIYNLTNDPIDVVIPSVPKDLETLNLCIDGIRRYGKNVRRIIVVSPDKYTDKAEWLSEHSFPFTKLDLAIEIFKGDVELAKRELARPGNRISWALQQLLKLCSSFMIPDISPNVLVLDSDTIFLNPVEFMNERNGAMFNPGTENHTVYFEHAARLIPGFYKIYPEHSGICHWILIQRPILEDLFRTVEETHGVPFWKAYCRCIDYFKHPSFSADYEVYFNYALSRTKQVSLQFLKWTNLSYVGNFHHFKSQNYHYVSCHAWARGQ